MLIKENTHTHRHLGEVLLEISDLFVVQGPRHQLQRQLLEGVRVSEVHQVRQRPLRELLPPTARVVVVEPGVMLRLRSSSVAKKKPMYRLTRGARQSPLRSLWHSQFAKKKKK